MTPVDEIPVMDALMDAKDLGRRIAELRRAAGMSRAEVADQAGVSVRTLEGWEQGRSDPPATAVFRIADALKVSVDSFKAPPPPPRRKPKA